MKIARDGQVHGSFFAFQFSVQQRNVCFLDQPRLEVFDELPMGCIISRDYNRAGRVFIEPMNDSRTHHAARLGHSFESCRNVDAITENIVLLGDDVVQVHSHAKYQAPVLGHERLLLRHDFLDRDGTAYRVDRARELGKQPVAH